MGIRIKRMRLWLPLLVLMLVVTGCTVSNENKEEKTTQETTQETKAPKEDTSFSITDMTGRKVTFDQVPEKMAILLASDVEILYALGAKDQIMAVGEYCNYPEEAKKKEVVTTGDNLNVEQIIGLEAQVVVMGTMGQTKEQIAQLEDAGVKVIVTSSKSIADTYTAIDILGQLSDKETQAKDLVDHMKREFAAIKEKAKDGKKGTVYFEVSPLEYGLWTAGSQTFMQELADIVGVENAFQDVTGWAEISEEQVLERNPDYIITSTMYSGEGDTPVEEIMRRNNWKKIKAIENKKVFQGDTDMMTRPGPRLVDAAKALYDFIYTE